MPYTTDAGLPFARDSQPSYKAAVRATRSRGEKTRLYLAVLGTDGPLSDHQSAQRLGLPLSSICSIRNAAADCGLIGAAGEMLGPYGHAVTLWRLIERKAG